MRKLLLMLYSIVLLCTQLIAQDRVITGKITDENGNPLANSSVVVKGTSVGTTTKDDGTFSLNIPASAKALVISSVGYADQSINIGNKGIINARLANANKDLQEVVVVAYGTQKKKDVTGAVSSIDASKIARQQIVSPTQALQGLAPGVLVINTTGQPGDNPTIRIRGVASVNASANPLIVLDGIPFDGNIANINPADIETMNVLKDATATSLYGSRAANGVILITTKVGKKGSDPTINAYSSFGVSDRAVPEYDFVTSQQYMELAWEARRNQAADAGIANPAQYATDNLITGFLNYNPYNTAAKPVGTDGKLVAGAVPAWNTDWTNEIRNSSIERKNIGLNVGGGSEKVRYFFSGDYLDQDGYVIKSNYKRISARFNIDADLRSWLTIGAKTGLSSSKQNYPDQSGSAFRNAVQFSRLMSNIYPLYMKDNNGAPLLDANGKEQYDFGGPITGRTINVSRPVAQNTNAVALQELDQILNDRLQTSLNTYGEVRFTNYLKFRSNFGIDRYILNTDRYQNPVYGDAASVKGRVSKERDITTSWTWNNMLSFQKSYGQHNLGAMASMEAYNYTLDYFIAAKTGFPAPGLTELGPGSTLETINSYKNQSRLTSYLGRLTYNFASKYFLEGTVRTDGSTRFEGDKRWGTFYAVGASWVLSEENFLKNVEFVNMLKLRGSYGEVGNNALQDINANQVYFPYLPYQFDATYPDLNNPGVYLTGIGNPDITWEKLSTFNIGLDFSLFKNRINGSIDYYNKNTFDLVFSKPFPGSTGITSVFYNIGKVTNKGVELNLNGKVISKKDFSWDVNFNIATVNNEITKLPQAGITSGNYRLEVGHSLNSFYVYEWAGVNGQNGLPQWNKDELDANGQPTGKKTIVNGISTATRYIKGSSIPKYTGGFGNNLTYKEFDFSFLFNYAYGGWVLDADYIGLMHGFTSVGQQLSTDILDRWTTPGQITDVPRLKVGQSDYGSPSTRHLFKGDYIRLRNVTFGYTMSSNLIKKFNVVKGIRFYVQADNYFTWTRAKKGMDPELNIEGTTGQRSSAFKTIAVGLNVGF